MGAAVTGPPNKSHFFLAGHSNKVIRITAPLVTAYPAQEQPNPSLPPDLVHRLRLHSPSRLITTTNGTTTQPHQNRDWNRRSSIIHFHAFRYFISSLVRPRMFLNPALLAHRPRLERGVHKLFVTVVFAECWWRCSCITLGRYLETKSRALAFTSIQRTGSRWQNFQYVSIFNLT